MENENLENSQEQVQAPEFTEVEQRALEMGWRPKTEFDGDDIDFVDAKEFVARKPLYDKISQQSKQIKNISKGMEALKELHSKVSETEYNRAIKNLKEERNQALLDGDVKALNQAEDKIRETEQEFVKIQQAARAPIVEQEPVLNPTFINWKNRNQWYDSIPYMRSYADEVGARAFNSGLDPVDVLKEVEKAVRKEFPAKFSNPNKGNSPAVGGNSGSKPNKGAEYQLTDMEHKAMMAIVRTGALTKEQYIADLKKVKGV